MTSGAFLDCWWWEDPWRCSMQYPRCCHCVLQICWGKRDCDRIHHHSWATSLYSNSQDGWISLVYLRIEKVLVATFDLTMTATWKKTLISKNYKEWTQSSPTKGSNFWGRVKQICLKDKEQNWCGFCTLSLTTVQGMYSSSENLTIPNGEVPTS